MDNKSKKCFCCGNELKENEQICSKCGAVIPIEIDPVAYERNRKALRWSAIVGLVVGFFTTILFGSIDPNSYLFLIGVLLGLGSAYLTSVCFDKYYKNLNAKPTSKVLYCQTSSSREEKWKAQEKIDKMILSRGDTLANQMLTAISSINAMWDCDTHLDKENQNAEFRSKVYLLAITPELFLSNYYLFKAGNHDDIKDSIYTERPYLVLETLIKMGLFIFETNNNIAVLKEIINGDKEEYIGFKILAQRILNEELKSSI